MGADSRASIAVHAPADLVWSLVSDVTRTADWSPDVVSCRWLGVASGPVVGAQFVGASRRGVHRWSTLCRVTVSEPGRRFAYHVRWLGRPIADWAWTITPDGEGCVVEQSMVDRRGRWVRTLSVLVTGVRDRSSYNARAMQHTVVALKAAAEARTR